MALPLVDCIWSFRIFHLYIRKYLKSCRNIKCHFFLSWQHKTFSLGLDANKFEFICPVFGSEFDMVLVFGVYILLSLFLDGLPSSSQSFLTRSSNTLWGQLLMERNTCIGFAKLLTYSAIVNEILRDIRFKEKHYPKKVSPKAIGG